jgi:hypothetical protein
MKKSNRKQPRKPSSRKRSATKVPPRQRRTDQAHAPLLIEFAPLITMDDALQLVDEGHDVDVLAENFDFSDPVLGSILKSRGAWDEDEDGDATIWFLRRSVELVPDGVEPLWLSVGMAAGRLRWKVFYPGDGSAAPPDELFEAREDLVAQLDRIESQPDPKGFFAPRV